MDFIYALREEQIVYSVDPRPGNRQPVHDTSRQTIRLHSLSGEDNEKDGRPRFSSSTPAQAQLLLVDDDVALGELVSEYATYEGYAVTTASTAEVALRMLARKAFALVILDVMLPGIDGFEALERLRHFSDVPVLMLTTRGAASIASVG